MEEETPIKDNQKEIDLSTTFFKLSTIPTDCSMSEFALSHDPPFEPTYGFGYYKIAHEDVKDIEPHKRVIMMEQLEVTINFASTMETQF